MNAKKYNNIKLFFSISKTFVTFLLIFLFVVLGYSESLVEYIKQSVINPYMVLLVFVFVTGVAMSVLFFPVNFYTDFILEHKYNL